MLYTSYYGNPHLDPDKVFLVRISNSAPGEFPLNFTFQEAIPAWETIVGPYKDGTITENDFVIRYRRQIESKMFIILLALDTILEQAKALGLQDIVFLCYEKPGRFCHRRVFAKWLQEKTGETVEEYPNPSTFEPTLF